MMTSLQKGIINIIRSALTGKKFDLPDDFSLKDALDIAKKHQIINLFYYGAVNCGIDPNDPLMLGVFNTVCSNISRNERQTYEYNGISGAFEKNGIDYLPLKGLDIRKLYPKEDMRIMGDIDILIKESQYAGITSVMTGLGFKDLNESNHEHIWKNNGVIVELHKRLIPSYNKDYYKYFGDGWQLAHPDGNGKHLFKMRDENNYVYIFAHFAKHYRDGGIGLRHLVDLYVCRNHYKELDLEYIDKELEKLHLKEFYHNVSMTLDALFENAEENDMTELITNYIFESGPYGTRMRQLISSRLKNANGRKAGEAMSIIFLPLENMKLEYPVLKKMPFFLPVFWVARGFRTVFLRKGRIKKNVEKLSSVNDDDVKEYKEYLNYVGLGFYNK
ncbi:MAG: nucleotidyltransferase family protein [Clostridia bacterium]|nr:nucleotidyltransferase family protein [Clostridia bacterium]